MNKQELYNKMVEHLKENVDTIKTLVSECHSWNGSLEDYDYWENDEEFFNTFFEGRPMEVARATFYGDYKYCDEYVHFNAYGNLDSCSDYEYEEILQDNAEEILDCYIELLEQKKLDPNDIYGDDTIKMYFDKYIDLLEGETTDDER